VPLNLMIILLTGFGMRSETGVLCAALAGLTVFLALRHPGGQLRRMTNDRPKVTAAMVPLARLIRGRPDAPALSRRLLLSTACALALAAAAVQAFDGPVADDLGRVLAMLKLGVGEAAAWKSIHDHPQLGLAAQDLARSVESGTSMVQGLQHHAAAAREVRRGALQVRARSVGVRSVLPMMICFIPSFMLLGIVPAVVSAVFNAFE
jgi:hypothetical protein